MKFRVIETTYNSARRSVVKELRGRMFHVTSPTAFVNICAVGAIRCYPSEGVERRWNGDGYFRNRNCISVVDLVNNTRPRTTAKKMLSDYAVFEQSLPVTVFMFLAPPIQAKAITWSHVRKDSWRGQQIVPELEAGIPECVPLAEVEEVWFISLKDRVTSLPRLEQLNRMYAESLQQRATGLTQYAPS